MTLRKWPNCREVVGADYDVCQRCGVPFRAAQIRRLVVRILATALFLCLLCHLLLKVV